MIFLMTTLAVMEKIEHKLELMKLEFELRMDKIRRFQSYCNTSDRPGSGQNSAGTIWMEYSSGVSSLRILVQMVSELQ